MRKSADASDLSQRQIRLRKQLSTSVNAKPQNFSMLSSPHEFTKPTLKDPPRHRDLLQYLIYVHGLARPRSNQPDGSHDIRIIDRKYIRRTTSIPDLRQVGLLEADLSQISKRARC